jgi:hypothetical protein
MGNSLLIMIAICDGAFRWIRGGDSRNAEFLAWLGYAPFDRLRARSGAGRVR